VCIQNGFHPSDIKFVSGSVEAACGLGLADAVVDLVETGTTMKVRTFNRHLKTYTANNTAVSSGHFDFYSLLSFVLVHRQQVWT
jgi:ATP phosphoribosyltransferase